MIGSFRNFAKTKFAGILVFIMIIPFVFWGMGSMFSSGNTNSIVKINESNVSTEEFIDYLNNSGIPQKTIRENLNNNIIEELLSGLVSTKILDLEIREYDLIISKETLLKMIKKNKNFLDDQGNFQRLKYEKFLLENNQSAPQFELRLKNRELQKNLFSFVGAGTVSPKFLVKKLYEEQNKKLEIDFINLDKFYKKKGDFTDNDLKKFLEENKENLKVDYLDFEYSIINPKNLIGVDEFNQSFFDKIDQIEIDISNEVPFNSIVSNLNLKSTKVKDFLFSSDKNEVEKKIFELKGTDFDIFELGDDYVLYKIQKNESREPDITNSQTKEEILDLIFQKNKFDYNTNLIEKIKNNEFNDNEFIQMGQQNIKTAKLNSIRDNKKFDINAVKILYSLPINSFTLINDEKENIYLAKVKDYQVELTDNNNEIIDYTNKQNSNLKNNMLKSYDLYLNSRYNVTLNQKTIERVKNFFQ
ncbi:SurA N-terminal domain-containing protein [Candidatus Pelagibacter sp. RS39]|uniref:SurA N-terminal domain-containing protein n=1 Tax=Candidatus Pelagibacter sp. RS39 TaxID=1977864 RepID=UPI000A167B80|nr:SurA N-terminal domain-containing protein [Candidatus Pelagibacter sp. RS39]ARJ47802.1 SurA [Candidatus Pelagibacter sp. RS39]